MYPSASDTCRRDLLQQYVPLDLSADWKTPQVIKAKSVRSLVLGGMVDHFAHGLRFNRPCGVIEIAGARTDHCATGLLMVFSKYPSEDIPGFLLRQGEALGIILHPAESFAGCLHIANSPSLYFRLGGTGEDNAVANDITLLQM